MLRSVLRDAAVGVSSFPIVDNSATLGRTVVECIEFDDRFRANRAEALHVAPPSM